MSTLDHWFGRKGVSTYVQIRSNNDNVFTSFSILHSSPSHASKELQLVSVFVFVFVFFFVFVFVFFFVFVFVFVC